MFQFNLSTKFWQFYESKFKFLKLIVNLTICKLKTLSSAFCPVFGSLASERTLATNGKSAPQQDSNPGPSGSEPNSTTL